MTVIQYLKDPFSGDSYYRVEQQKNHNGSAVGAMNFLKQYTLLLITENDLQLKTYGYDRSLSLFLIHDIFPCVLFFIFRCSVVGRLSG